MKRLASLTAATVLALSIGGCPIYPDNDDDGYCGQGRCYDDDYCGDPGDCGAGEVCGVDNECHIGACDTWGCPSGYRCDAVAIDVFKCIVDDHGLGGQGGGGGSGGEGGGPSVVWCGNPSDCALNETCATDGTCQPGDCSQVDCIYGYVCDEGTIPAACVPTNPAACGEDLDCAEGGADNKCLSGICTVPADQCFDQTQCASGSVCADGKCVPSCAGGEACPSSYGCDGLDLCTVPVDACQITNDCGGPDRVCVDGACVPRSLDGACASGDVWVENGCIPDQAPTFVCLVEGQQDVCAAGSICVHHSCYISCEAPNDMACAALPEFNLCKPVVTQTGTYPVCGSDSNLGGECDPTASIDCAPGLVCIDGFCT